MRFGEVETCQRYVIVAPVQVAQKVGKEVIVPFAADFIERDIERLFFALVEVYNNAVDFGVAEVFHHFEPLVSTHHYACALIPNDGLDIAELQNAPLEFFVFCVARLQVFARIIGGGF